MYDKPFNDQVVINRGTDIDLDIVWPANIVDLGGLIGWTFSIYQPDTELAGLTIEITDTILLTLHVFLAGSVTATLPSAKGFRIKGVSPSGRNHTTNRIIVVVN